MRSDALVFTLLLSWLSPAWSQCQQDFGIAYHGVRVFSVSQETSTCSCSGGYTAGPNSTSTFGGSLSAGTTSISAPANSSAPALTLSAASPTDTALSIAQGVFRVNGYDMFAAVTALTAQLSSLLLSVNSATATNPTGGNVTLFSEPFAGAGLPGWTFTHCPAAQFSIGPAVASSCGSGKGVDPAVDHSSPSSNVLGCAIGGCYVQNGTAYTSYATSPIIDASQCSTSTATLSFWRVLGSSPNNHQVVDALTAPGNWINVYDSVGGVSGASWNENSWSLKTYQVGHNFNGLFQLRWGLIEAASGNPDGAGWSVDDITLSCLGKSSTNKTFSWQFNLGTPAVTWYVKLVNTSIDASVLVAAAIDGVTASLPTIRTLANGDRVVGWWDTLVLAGVMSGGAPSSGHVVSITLSDPSHVLRSPSYLAVASAPGALPLTAPTSAP